MIRDILPWHDGWETLSNVSSAYQPRRDLNSRIWPEGRFGFTGMKDTGENTWV